MSVLAYVEHNLPAPDGAARLALAREHDLALEVANGRDVDLDAVRRSGVPVAAVQAYDMHRWHPLHPDPACRAAALPHVRDTIEQAARLGAPRVVTVCGFGAPVCDRPLERCVELFAAVAPFARDRGVRVLIEPLSPRRSGAMTAPEELAALHDRLAAPDVFRSLLDTGHLMDGGHDPADAFRAWPLPVEEVQLRGRDSRPPAADVPLARWLAALPAAPDLVAVEHPEPIAVDAFVRLLAHLRRELSAAAAARSPRSPGSTP